MAEKQVKIVIAADVAAALRGLQQVEQGLGRVGEQGNQAGASSGGFMDKLQTGLSIVGVQAGFDGIVAGFKSVVSSGMEYEQAMSQLQAVTGASESEMAAVSVRAKELGSDLSLPGASAQSATQALLELSKGGLTLDESMSAVRGTLVLAAAAQIDGAQAAEIQSSALNTFGLAASDADRVANVLANTANASAGEITDFAQGLAQAGTIANSFGWSIEETSTYLGLMANAGIKGSDAGTSLKTTLTSMLSPTKQQSAALQELGIVTHDANGNMISAAALTQELAAAKGRMSQADFTAAAATAFGSDAVRTALVAAEAGTVGYNDMSDAISKAGGAQAVAAANAEGLTGAMDNFASTAETAGLALYEKYSPALQSAVSFGTSAIDVVSNMAGAFAELPGYVQGAVVALGLVIATRGPLLAAGAAIRTLGATILGTSGAAAAGSVGFAGWIASMRAATGAAATLSVAAKGLWSAIGGPIGLAIIAITSGLALWASSSSDAEAATTDLTGAVNEQTGVLNENAQAVIAKAAAESGALQAYEAAGGNVEDYTAALAGNVEMQDRVRQTLRDAADAAMEAGTSYDAAAVGADGLGLAVGDSTGVIGAQAGAYDSANAMLGQFETELGNVNAAQEKGALVNKASGTAIEGTGAAAAEAAPEVETYAEAIKTAIDNAKFLADNTELESYLAGGAAAADELSSAMDYLSLKFAEIAGRNVTAEQAAVALNDAYRGVEDAFKKGTAAATENSEAGNLNIDALNRWDVATLTATEDGSKMYDVLNTIVDAHGQVTASAYLDAIATGDVAGAANIARQKATDSRKAFVDLAAQYNGGNIPAAEELANKLGVLDGTQIDDKTFETILNDAVANGKLTALQAAEIKSKTFAINAEDQATPTMDRIRSYQIADKTYTIRAVTVGGATEYATPSGAVARADGGMVPGPHAAAGRLVAGRGTSAVMDGSGAGLTWAEAATNKEYYLSMKAGMEQRNRGLASQAVSDLGGQAVWGRPDVRAGSFSPPPAQRVIVELTGEGITAEMARTAIVTVNGALVEVAQGINRGRGQS